MTSVQTGLDRIASDDSDAARLVRGRKVGLLGHAASVDRELRAGPYRGTLSVADLDKWARPEMKGVVLELKFTNRFPSWMLDLVQWFNLTRGPFPKYVKCVTLLNQMPEH